MNVDRRVPLRGRCRQRGSGAEDLIWWEVFGLVNLLNQGLDTPQCTAADDSHPVFTLLLQFIQLLAASNARLRMALQFGDGPTLFVAHILFHLILRKLKIEFLLEVNDHATKVLADEVGEQLGADVALIDVCLLMISFERSAQASKASSSEKTGVLSQSKRNSVI